MIISIYSNKDSFKRINFNEGFNVILAERTKESTQKDSRNGLGKSTLIEIIHFCLGGNKGETLSNANLDDWTFIMELKLQNKKYKISRNTSDTNKIFIEGNFELWEQKPDLDGENNKSFFTAKNWNKILGEKMFELKSSYGNLKYVPTFRSLISYFVRRNGQSGSYLSPFQQYKNQLEWDKQVNNSFLLNLNWKLASKLQILKDREKILSQIKQEVENGLISNMMGNVGELEALKVRLKAQIKEEEEQLNSFKVHPQYENIENESNNYTEKIHDKVDKNILDKKLLERYEDSLKDEKEIDSSIVLSLYKEAGVKFSDSIKKELKDVLEFHEIIIKNRKDFLKTEIDRIKHVLEVRKKEVEELSEKRRKLLGVLSDHGALSEHIKMRENYQKTLSELNDISNRLENLKKFEEGKSSINIEKELFQQQGKEDLKEREIQREKAILLFNKNSKTLYQTSGTLSIDFKKTGFKFDVKIERSGSHGIGNMKIFSYDLMLSQLWSERNKGPGFLVHDSILFADVDERQRAIALELAKEESTRKGFQYICTLNSDSIPEKDFSENFNIKEHVVLTLTDEKEDTGLLGIRF